jgi:hypothetical protein
MASITKTRTSFNCLLSVDTRLLSTHCFNFGVSNNQPISQTPVTWQALSSIISSRNKSRPASAVLDSTVLAELLPAASSSHSCDSDQNLLFDILTLAHFIGTRVSEYAQTTQDKVDYHVYPSGTCIIKAFTANYFIFYNKNSQVLKKIDNSSFILAVSVQITWRIQKNYQNSQKIKLYADTKNPAIFPVQGALLMVMRARRLAQPDDMPVAYFRTKKAPLLFITGSRIAAILCEAVQKVPPSTLADDLKKYSAHSLRVWECVGGYVPFLHPKTSLLVRRFLQNVSLRH